MLFRLLERLATAALAALLLNTAQASPMAPNYASEDRVIMQSPAYLATHPDLRLRNEGLQSLQEGDTVAALQKLAEAARYADKAAQAVIAEIYWQGRGVAVDRARGYAWMDLAAERLYARYVGHRERYWQALSASERTRAVEIGRELYPQFGDEVAKPRLEASLRRERGRSTGSRTGASVGARAYNGTPPGLHMTGAQSMHLRGFDEAKYWHPKQYWDWQDSVYRSLRKPRVMVKELTLTLGKRGAAH